MHTLCGFIIWLFVKLTELEIVIALNFPFFYVTKVHVGLFYIYPKGYNPTFFCQPIGKLYCVKEILILFYKMIGWHREQYSISEII